MSGAAGFLDRNDLFKHFAEVAREKCTTIDHHVNFVGAGSNCFLGVSEFDVKGCTSAGERGSNRCNMQPVANNFAGDVNQVAIHTYRRDTGSCHVGGVGVKCFGAHGPDLAGGISAFQGR